MTSSPARPGPALPDGVLGVVFDADGILGITALQHPLRAVRSRVGRSADDRRSVMGMAGVLRRLVQQHPGAPVVYLTTAPTALAQRVEQALSRDGYPPGRLAAADGGPAPWWLLRDGRRHKQAVLDRLFGEDPTSRWVLVGDDGADDPALYAACARRHPGRVAAVALRLVRRAGHAGPRVDAATTVTGLNGEELLPQLEACLGLDRPAPAGVEDWFLTAQERGNDATRLRAWTQGNAVRALVHGGGYFAELAAAVGETRAGDRVLLAGWRADADERLTAAGPTAGEALAGAARRGVDVRGLLWRSHATALGFSAEANRRMAQCITAAGGSVRLDRRVRVLGSHHQKLVVVRNRGRADSDVAFVGGLDLAHCRRDDGAHRGDPQAHTFAEEYGPTPPWHDVQLALRGPAVADSETVFRERWEDPRPVSLPADDPPPAGTCAVQLLRTYPRRRPKHSFAPDGERSVARAYAKALSRAERLVYVEDQYLWSSDVARVFATALQRAPRLHLVVVVPRFPDQENPFRRHLGGLGQSMAMEMVLRAGGDRVLVLDVETERGTPVYVHSKLCVVDDVWAAVGSPNLNRRSWTHDSELAGAVLDSEHDHRPPLDPAGRGDGARRFARDLRLRLMREHLGRGGGDDGDLLDPAGAVRAVRESVAALDRWHRDGRAGPRPQGRLRRHPVLPVTPGQLRLAGPLYRAVFDPDGRPVGMRVRRTF